MRLRTKFTLVMTGLVLFVVAVLSYAFGVQLLEQLISETDKRAADLSQQVLVHAENAPVEALQQGLLPAHYGGAREEIHDYMRNAFESSEGLQTQFIAAKKNPLIYEVSITDTNGLVLASTDHNLPGTVQPRRASLSQFAGRSFLHQMKVLFAHPKNKNPQLFEVEYAFFLSDSKPFGEVRVVVDSAVLVQEIQSRLRTGAVIVLVALVISALLAALVCGITVARLFPASVSRLLPRVS